MKVVGRSRDRAETCFYVLPYRELEGINSFIPGQTIPLQAFHVSSLVETAPNRSFRYLRFYTELFCGVLYCTKIKNKNTF